MKHRFFIKIAQIITLSTVCILPAQAILPVFDWTNIAQNTVTAATSVKNYLQQAKQFYDQLQQFQRQVDYYKTQINYYKQMAQNPKDFSWSNVKMTYANLVDTGNDLKKQKEKIDKFRKSDNYKKMSCLFSSDRKCTDKEIAELSKVAEENEALNTQSQIVAADAVLKNVDAQGENLDKDVKKLEKLQTSAESAKGQVEAIQYTNQLASTQSSQLIQIRSLLMAQQTAEALRMKAEAEKKATEQVATQFFTDAEFQESTPKSRKF
jgi:P-type conjugative transfer protein TrbJ